MYADRLPERIRPNILAFGGVADGFVPFEARDKQGQEVQLKLASIVMKAVQVCGFPCCLLMGYNDDHVLETRLTLQQGKSHKISVMNAVQVCDSCKAC